MAIPTPVKLRLETSLLTSVPQFASLLAGNWFRLKRLLDLSAAYLLLIINIRGKYEYIGERTMCASICDIDTVIVGVEMRLRTFAPNFIH